MPSKVYGCIELRRPILFVGSGQSDVDLLCREADTVPWYRRVPVGAVAECADALEALARVGKAAEAIGDGRRLVA